MRRENKSLWQVRHLWTALCGDHTWVPCENMIGTNDTELYTDDHVARHLLSLSKASADEDGEAAPLANGNGKPEQTDHDGSRNEDGDVSMADADPSNENKNLAGSDADAQPRDADVSAPEQKNNSPRGQGSIDNNQALTNGNATTHSDANESGQGKSRQPVASGNGLHESGGTDYNAPSVAPEATEQPFVHPIFLPPAGVRPDRDLRLPEGEAEEVRRLLALFVQKQEEVCRGVQRLHDGLSKAHRLRKDVLHWSKAEAHSGVNRDMSDGEDWYDKEEWGLTEDLKKGQDDEEEDTTATAKKTRTRR